MQGEGDNDFRYLALECVDLKQNYSLDMTEHEGKIKRMKYAVVGVGTDAHKGKTCDPIGQHVPPLS